ncbi:hypothetical protein PanWU01x14_333830 [Parasponia andersonii]|uniref:Uncharacterized protein n=1 Tax=Parasponia andersonii TaxID=3476 RepID=A0A2P5AGS2_PARAD|nr:hypothetical protein PanWU01x14_333830 [Parasponia andersonii]
MDPHRLFHEALPSKLNLIRRKLLINPLCDQCQEEIESLEHCFLKNWRTFGDLLEYGIFRKRGTAILRLTSCFTSIVRFLRSYLN